MGLVKFFFILLFIFLQYQLWVGNSSFVEIKQLDSKLQDIKQENIKLKKHKDSLTSEVLDLKHGYEAIEERARSEMGMIGHDETFYQIVDYSNLKKNKHDK